MASFASQPAQFSPYVPLQDAALTERLGQQELQAQVQVGTFKQGQYNTNVQRIQGAIDSLAGIQLMKDVDKAYMREAMAGFEKEMQGMIKSDFSMQSRFNQATALAGKVGNDPIINSAAASTKMYQDAQAQMQEAHKNGKSSVTNDNMIQRNLNRWAQDQTPGASLGKQQYTNFFDYNKGFQDFMSGKHANVVVRQDPFGTSPDGSVSWSAYALQEGKEVKLDPLEVQRDAATYFASNAQAKEQLDIDSVYYSDRTDSKTAFQQYQASNREVLEGMGAQIKSLESDMALNPENRAKNQAAIQQYREAITQRQALNRKNEETFLSDPEGAKRNLFQSSILQGFGSRFAYTELDRKIVKNPIFDAMLDQEKFNLDKQKFAWGQETWKMDFDQSERKMANDIKAAQISAGLTVGGQYDAAKAEAITPGQYEQDLKATAGEVLQGQLGMLFNSGAYNDLVEVGQNASGDTIYKTKAGVTQEQVNMAVNTTRKSYQDNPQGANRALKEYFSDETSESSGVGLERAYFAEAKRFRDIKDEVNNRYKNDPAYKDYQKQVESLGDYSKKVSDNITRGDIISYAKAFIIDQNQEKVAQSSGLSLSKVQEIQKKYYASGTTGFRTEVDRVFKVVDQDIYKKYDTEVKAVMQNLMPNTSKLSVAEKINDKNANKLAALTTFAMEQPDKSAEFAAVTGEKGAGDIILGVTKNTITGKPTAFIRNSNGTTASIDINDVMAAQLQPQLMQTDPYASVERVLDANQGKFRGVKTNTGNMDVVSYTPKVSNLKNYRVRFGYERSANKTGYAPLIQYKKVGQDYWTPLPYEVPYFRSKAEATNFVEQEAMKGDQYFESVYLNDK